MVRQQGKTLDPGKLLESVKAFGMVFFRVGIVLYLFYKSVFVVLVAGIPAGIAGIYFGKKQRQRQWQRQINLEFREGLQGVAAALNAGYSVENAFREAKKDLLLLYGSRSALVPEFQELICQMELNCPVEQVLMNMADRSGVEDIRRFAEIFQTAKRTGGDLIHITRMTADRISEKIEVKREIETMIAGKEMEVKVMKWIPLGMILYFWTCSPGFLDCLYQGAGRIVMTVLLGIYLFAWYWSERISQISV